MSKVETQTTPHHSEVEFIETPVVLGGCVKVTERWIPAKEGEEGQVLFGNWDEGFTSMKLEGRYINGKRI
jgi:hypothetical protein